MFNRLLSSASNRRSSARTLTFKDDHATQKRKREWLLQRQQQFVESDRANEELKAWKNGEDVEGGFRELGRNGIIPAGLVGKTTNGASKPWHASDTFFSEFADHNPSHMILSDSNPDSDDSGSLIISNHSTHDSRQYAPWLDAKFAPKPDGKIITPEGQAFGHTLVIPKPRIFNVVDPDAYSDNCAILRELRSHFTTFWSDPANRQKLLSRMTDIFNAQNEILLASGKEQAKGVVEETTRDFEALKAEFEKLGEGDFVFGVHPWDTNSVGHLHLHVFPREGKFRRWSAVRHDGKTVTFEDVVAAEAVEKVRKEKEEKKRKGKGVLGR